MSASEFQPTQEPGKQLHIGSPAEIQGDTVQAEVLSRRQRVKNKINGAIIGIEISPLNEVGRFGALAIAMASTNSNPPLSAAAIGLATAGFETPAAYAAADVLEHSEKSRRSIERVNKFTDSVKKRLGMPEDTKTSIPTKLGLAYFGGSAVSTINLHREDPSRTKSENLRSGLLTSGALTSVSTAQGYLIASGIEHPSPGKLAGTALAIGTVVGANKVFKGVTNLRERRRTEPEEDNF